MAQQFGRVLTIWEDMIKLCQASIQEPPTSDAQRRGGAVAGKLSMSFAAGETASTAGCFSGRVGSGGPSPFAMKPATKLSATPVPDPAPPALFGSSTLFGG